MVSTSIAFDWLVLGIAFILIGGLILLLPVILNPVFNVINGQISSGMLSNSTINAINYNISWIGFIPLIVIIMGLLCIVISAIENKGSGA